ncbi:MAG: hypothetical protein PHV28_17180 [Kiritimatiellae bacterium]|nr:hypothetical protein [Kiritimatiellia bacterium]
MRTFILAITIVGCTYVRGDEISDLRKEVYSLKRELATLRADVFGTNQTLNLPRPSCTTLSMEEKQNPLDKKSSQDRLVDENQLRHVSKSNFDAAEDLVTALEGSGTGVDSTIKINGVTFTVMDTYMPVRVNVGGTNFNFMLRPGKMLVSSSDDTYFDTGLTWTPTMGLEEIQKKYEMQAIKWQMQAIKWQKYSKKRKEKLNPASISYAVRSSERTASKTKEQLKAELQMRNHFEKLARETAAKNILARETAAKNIAERKEKETAIAKTRNSSFPVSNSNVDALPCGAEFKRDPIWPISNAILYCVGYKLRICPTSEHSRNSDIGKPITKKCAELSSPDSSLTLRSESVHPKGEYGSWDDFSFPLRLTDGKNFVEIVKQVVEENPETQN